MRISFLNRPDLGRHRYFWPQGSVPADRLVGRRIFFDLAGDEPVRADATGVHVKRAFAAGST
jgi:hypothetical protein